ncbi:MAG: histidine--tRNA ligase [Rhodospirillaceae bacterium]|nr:histidine--tRNA ligase [Rhodospirillaceae bacterium]
MASLNPVRGTQDILPEESRLYRRVEETAFEVAERYGFGEITTPIFEFTEVFSRTLGDTSDIVTKEMYTFEDKGGDQITLRPENTAGVARAFISNGLQQNLPLKLFYRGPMFRYERPQKGRRRQFRQVGVEILGVATPQADIETISIAQTFLEELGLKDNITLELNSLGDSESRGAYRDELVKYLSGHQDKLSQDSLERLERNPLRILDSKDEADQAVIVNAPRLQDSLNDTSQSFFNDLCEGLNKLGIAFVHNTKLVRGLDYYCHTAFEFTTTDLGAQGTVLAGGRYDGLVAQMGGPETPGIGWAAGVERLSLLLDEGTEAKRPIVVIPVGGEAESEAMVVTEMLRKKGYRVDLGYSGNLKKRMKRANLLNAAAAILLGEDELTRNVGTLRDMDSGEQKEVSLETLEDHLAPYK